jgi:hypothetical protein
MVKEFYKILVYITVFNRVVGDEAIYYSENEIKKFITED